MKSKNKPLVSIVTPSYNQGEFLEDAIKSVLRQNYPRIEYIIIDGGSGDGSLDIIKKYKGDVAHWVSEPDRGQSDAINKGFSMARGEIIAWLNSDDMYLPGAVERAVTRFQENSSLALFYGDAVFVNRQGNFRRYFTEVEPFDEFRLRNCTDFIMQPTTFFLRKAFDDSGGLDTSLDYAMDYDLWCRLARNGYRFHYEQDLIAANREYAGTKTVTGDMARLYEILKVLRRHRSSLWPHAGFSYVRTFLLDLLERNHFPGKEILAMGVLYGMGITCWRNFLYSRKHTVPIGGLMPHSNLLLKNVRLCVPVFRNVRGIMLGLEVPFRLRKGLSQKVRVTINDEDLGVFHFRGETSRQDIVINCGKSINLNSMADVRLEFSHVYRVGRRKKEVAASLSALSLVYEGGSGL